MSLKTVPPPPHHHQLKGVFTVIPVLVKHTQFLNHGNSQSSLCPREPKASVLNDFRPLATTSIHCKPLERVAASHLTSSVALYLAQTHTPRAWCKSSNLEISLDKTEEIIIFAKQDFTTESVVFNGQHVETVEKYSVDY